MSRDIEAAAAARWPDQPIVRRGRTLRVGSNVARGGGSIVVELAGPRKGAWFDHAEGAGGWLIDDGTPRPAQDPVRPRPARFVADERAETLRYIVGRTRPALGTLAERYFARRGLELGALAARSAEARQDPIDKVPEELPIRFLAGDPMLGHAPAIVFLAQTVGGETVAAQLVALTADGRKDTTAEVVKRTLVAGRDWHRVAAFNLPAVVRSATLLIAEGPETAASLWQATGLRTSSALGPHFGALDVAGAERVVICRDTATPGSSADVAHWRNALELIERGFACAVADVRCVGFGRDQVGSDFNDLLGARGEAAVRQAVDTACTIERGHCERRLARWQRVRDGERDALASHAQKETKRMSTTIGMFEERGDGSLEGKITTLTVNSRVKFVPVNGRRNDDAPDYRLFAGNFEVGAGWERTSERGTRYVNVVLDDPSFAAPVYAALMPADEDNNGGRRLVWSRTRRSET